MSAAETWLMMGARAQNYISCGRSVNALTSSEVARLLAGLKTGPFLMGMATHVFDVQVLDDVELCLDAHVKKRSARIGWPDAERSHYRREIAGVVVFEILKELPQSCKACQGRGFLIVDNNGAKCEACGNLGGRKLSANERADLIGMPRRAWKDPWPARYEAVRWVAITWRDEALSYLAQRLQCVRLAA